MDGRSTSAALLVCAAVALCASFRSFGGELAPPAGPIGPSMKNLEAVEPRGPVGPDTTPGDADSLFRITEPGSYYLTGSVAGVAGKHGIEIASPNVTLDLMGFEIVGVPGSLTGVSVVGGGTGHVALANGSVREWGGDGVSVSSADGASLRDLVVRGNGGSGLAVFGAGTIERCVAVLNGGTGIEAEGGLLVTGCTSEYNGARGFLGSDAIYKDCAAISNATDGFDMGSGSLISGCRAEFNGDDGIVALFGASITGNVVQYNGGDGIEVGQGDTVLNNTCHFNGSGGDGAGIHVTGTSNRIEGNSCTSADRGIDVDFAKNLIIRNSCSGNPVNFDIVADNRYGPIVDLTAPGTPGVTGNSGADTTETTHPWANFAQ